MIYWWLFWDAVSENYWRFRRFTLFNVLGCLPHRWCHRVVQTLQGANSQFLVPGTVSLETYPCLSHPKFQHPTRGLSDVSYIQKDVAKKTGAMALQEKAQLEAEWIWISRKPAISNGPWVAQLAEGRRSCWYLVTGSCQKRTLSCLSAIQSHKSVLFRCRMRQGHLRTRAWQST